LTYCAEIAFNELTNEEYVEILFKIATNTNFRDSITHFRKVLQYAFALSEEKQVYYKQEVYEYIGCYLDGDLVYLEI